MAIVIILLIGVFVYLAYLSQLPYSGTKPTHNSYNSKEDVEKTEDEICDEYYEWKISKK